MNLSKEGDYLDLFHRTKHKHKVLQKYKNRLTKERRVVNYEYDKEKKEIIFKCLHRGYLLTTPLLCGFDPENAEDLKLLEMCLKELKSGIAHVNKVLASVNAPESQ